MNCLEFRRLLLIEPCSSDNDFVAHRAKCANCGHEVVQTEQFERRFREVLSVDPPEGLRDRIMLEHALMYGKSRHGTRTQWLAMAASLLMAIGIAGWLGYDWGSNSNQPLGLEASVLGHINDELDHLYEDRDLQREQLAGLLDPFGIKMENGIGRVKYAGRCTIRKHSGIHLVIPGQQGPVTILLMPGEYVNDSQAIRSPRFSGVIVPTDYGSMAVIGEYGEVLDEVITQVSKTVVRNI